VIAATYVREGGTAEATSRLTKLFEESGDALAGHVSTARVALGWSHSSLVDFPRCDPPLVAVALGSVDPATVLACPTFESSLELRDPVALFAATEQELVIARGPFGGRPVYFAVEDKGDTVIACSDLLPVVKQIAAPTEVDAIGLAAQIADCVGPEPTRTPYRHIRRLGACEVARFGGGRQTVSVEIARTPSTRAGAVETFAAEFREVLVDVIAREARGLSEASVMTGGGLDSSGLLAAAELGYRSGRHDCRFRVVAMDFGGPGDDRPHLRALCSALGLEPLRVQTQEGVALAPSALIADAAPFAWPTSPMEMAVMRRAAEGGAQAVFTGTGGDWMTFGDLSVFSNGLSGRRLLSTLWDAARLQTMWPSSPRSRMINLVLRPVAQRLAPRSLIRGRRVSAMRRTRRWTWAGPRLRSFLLQVERPERAKNESWYSEVARSTDLVKVVDLRGQSERESGLGERCPYLDGRLVEFVASLPAESLFHRHDDRGLFREAMRGLLPESVRTRPDKASFEPMIRELASGAYASGALSKFVRMEALGDLGLVNPSAFQVALTKASAEGDGFAWGEAWPALCAEAFLQEGWAQTRASSASRGGAN
jgi:asparagine synthase (glutamine-hydrolysing)